MSRKLSIILLLPTLFLAGCERVELAVREAVAQVSSGVGLTVDEQTILCEREGNAPLAFNKCMHAAGWEQKSIGGAWHRAGHRTDVSS